VTGEAAEATGIEQAARVVEVATEEAEMAVVVEAASEPAPSCPASTFAQALPWDLAGGVKEVVAAAAVTVALEVVGLVAREGTVVAVTAARVAARMVAVAAAAAVVTAAKFPRAGGAHQSMATGRVIRSYPSLPTSSLP